MQTSGDTPAGVRLGKKKLTVRNLLFAREQLFASKQKMSSPASAPPAWMCDLSEGDLKRECSVKGLKKTGTRTSLLARLAGHSAGKVNKKNVEGQKRPPASTSTTARGSKKPLGGKSSSQSSGQPSNWIQRASQKGPRKHEMKRKHHKQPTTDAANRRLLLVTWDIARDLYAGNTWSTFSKFHKHMASKTKSIKLSDAHKQRVFRHIFEAFDKSPTMSNDNSDSSGSSDEYSDSSDDYSDSSTDAYSSSGYSDSYSSDSDGG